VIMKNTQQRWNVAARERRGGSLVMMSMSATALATLAFSMAVVSKARSEEQADAKQELSALYAAEAALAEAVFAMENGGTGDIQAKSSAGAAYSVQSGLDQVDPSVTILTAAATTGSARARVELQVRETTSSIWQYGAFGDIGLTMDSNAMVDSYDSGLGTSYAAQQVNGSGNSQYASSNGNVGSNQDITIQSNAGVHGNATPGPSGATTLVGNNTYVTGTTTPAPDTVTLDPIVVPPIASSGDYLVGSDTTLAAGSYGYDTFEIDADMTIVGPTTIVAEHMLMQSNSTLTIDATNGPVEFYVKGDFVLDSNTEIRSTTDTPSDVSLMLLSDNIIDPGVQVDVDYVDFNSNALLYGTIYAPSAAIDVNSNFQLYGALLAKAVHLDSNSGIHFDEALLNLSQVSGAVTYKQVGWRLLSDD